MNTSMESGLRSSTVDRGESRPLGALAPANRLLRALPAADLQRWQPHLELVSLPAGTALSRGGEFASHVYFPTTASVSLMYTTRDGSSLEIVAIGNEGMVGLQALMGGHTAPEAAVVRVDGHGYRVSRGWMQEEFHQNPTVMGLLLRYMQTLMTHTAQSVVCNTHHSVEQRLCRCLLGKMDCSQGAPMTLTHENLGYMLGVRREGVTGVAVKLQRAGVIHYTRGRVVVVDPEALEERSCECYRVVKTAYDKVLPALAPVMDRLSRAHDMPASPAPWASLAHRTGHSRARVEGGVIAR